MPTAAGTTGALQYNNAGAFAAIAPVASGQVLTSAGTGTVEAFSAVPVLGVAASQAGTLGLAKGVSGGAVWTLGSAATTAWTMTGAATAPALGDILDFSSATGQMSSLTDVAVGQVLESGGVGAVPTYNGTAPAKSGQVFSMTTAGVGSWIATPAHITAGPNTFGNNTIYATGVPIMQVVAGSAGHFTQLASTNITLNAGSCTTAPTFNVFDGATNLGTAKIASATVQAKGTATTQAETQTFAAGDVIGIIVSTAGSVCLLPIFAVSATVVNP